MTLKIQLKKRNWKESKEKETKMTFSLILEWLDNNKDCVDEYMMVVKNKPFISNMRTVYRETEDQLPGVDTTE